MKSLPKLKLILDENVFQLEPMLQLAALPYQIEFFYCPVDPYHMSDKHKSKLVTKKRADSILIAQRYIEERSRIFSNPEFFYKLHLIPRPDSTSLLSGQNFTDTGVVELPKSDHLQLKPELKRYTEMVTRLKQLYPNWQNHLKDLIVLAIALTVSDDYSFIKTLTSAGMFMFFFDTHRPSVVNENGQKIFITNDKRGLFSPKSIASLSKYFPELKITRLEDILTNPSVTFDN